MTKAYTAFRIAFLSCFIACSVVKADVVLKVIGDNVNLRAIADGESEVVSQVSRGTILHADKFIGGDWVGVSVPDGVAVWVYAELVKDDIVAVSKLSVRSGPGINYRTVGMLFKGDKVTSHGTINGWMKIDASENCRVWISSKYVALAGSIAKSITSKTDIRPRAIPFTVPEKKSAAVPVVSKPIAITLPVTSPVKQPTIRPEIIIKPAKQPVVVPIVVSNPQKEKIEPGEELTLEPPILSKPEPIVVAKPIPVDKPAKTMKPLIVKPEVVSVVELEPELVVAKKEVTEPKNEVVKVKEPVAVTPKLVIIEAMPIDTPIVVIAEPEEKHVDESVVELVSMSTEVLERSGEDEVLVKLESTPIVDGEKTPASSLVSEVVSTPKVVVVPILPTVEASNIEPEKVTVQNHVVDVVVIEPAEATVESVKLPVAVEPVISVESIDNIELPAVESGEVDKYAAIDTNSIPEGIELDRLVLSMPQGTEIIMTGKLKRAGRILRRRPSRYRLIGSNANCYVLSENDNLNEFLGGPITVTGKSYWVQGVRDMVISIDNIKKISNEPVLP